MPKPRRTETKNKTFRIPAPLEARLERRALESHTSVNQVVVQLLEQGLPDASPFERVRALRERLARQRSARSGPVPRFTKDELHGDDEA
jgi:hypothetical protein